MRRSIDKRPSGFAHINIEYSALLIQFIISASFNIMGGFFPLFISVELNYPLIDATYWAGMLSLVSSSIMALTATFWGFMCDRVGAKKILTIALTGNTLAYAGMALSTSITQMVLFRALQGTFGGVSTVMFTLVASVVSAQNLQKALSYQIATMTVASIASPGIGGVLASIVGYRWTLMTSAILFIGIMPLVYMLRIPPPTVREDEDRFRAADFKAIMPDFVSLILVYACINFITPVVPWFLESLGTPNDQLLIFTTLTIILNGIAFAVTTAGVSRVISDKALPILSAVAGGAILASAFVRATYQFIALRILIGAVQAGIPPRLLGGKSGRKGITMGFLNSARFMGSAIGPFLATSLLRNGKPTEVLYMFTTMASISFIASFSTYLTHTRKPSK